MSTKRQRAAFLVMGAVWAAAGLAQTPDTTGGGDAVRRSAPADVVMSGSHLAVGTPASPRPSPDLTTGVAFPRQGAPVDAGPFQLYPFLGVGVGYNDNVTGVRDEEIGSTLLLASPRLQAVAQSAGNVYRLTYGGNFGHYTDSSDNDFSDHAFVASSSHRFTSRIDLEAAAFFLAQHDAGGSVDRPFAGTPDRYHVAGAIGTFGYGAPSAQGRLELDLGYTDKRYQNNQESTAIFDVASWNAAARFFYRVAPATRLLAEIRYDDYDYRLSTSPYDSSEQRFLVGATWDATAATSGTLRLGYASKRFKSDGIDDYSGLSAEAVLRWLPRTYSTVEVVATYGPSDSTGSETYTVDTAFGARWDHYWRSHFLTRVYGSYTDSDLQGIARTDRITRVGAGAYYDVRRWLRVGAEYAYERRNSTDASFDYTRNVVLLSIAGTL